MAIVAALYGVLCLAILLGAPFLDSIAGTIPRPLGAIFAIIFIIIAGPATLLAGGVGGINWFIAVLAAVAVCLGLSWVAWRRYPDSELFVLGLLGATVLWAALPLLLMFAFAA